MAKVISVSLPFREALRSRMFVALWLLMAVQVVALAVIVALMIEQSPLQEPVQLSQFSQKLFYTERWTYLWNFVLFGGLTLVLNSVVSLKILQLKGRSLALGFLGLTVAMLAIVTTLVVAIMRVAGIGA